MAYSLQCNISLQDCESLYPPQHEIIRGFTNESCMRDPCLEGNIGRCGFPGAKCISYNGGYCNNCAQKGELIENKFASTADPLYLLGLNFCSTLCQNGICMG